MEETYKLPLTGEQIAARLALLDGNNNAVAINADKVVAKAETKATDSNLTLTTKSYVDSKVNTIHSGSGVPDTSIGKDGDLYIMVD